MFSISVQHPVIHVKKIPADYASCASTTLLKIKNSQVTNIKLDTEMDEKYQVLLSFHWTNLKQGGLLEPNSYYYATLA